MYCVNNWKLGQCAVWRLPKWPEPTDWPGDDCATPNPPATTPNPQPTFPNPNPTTSFTHTCTQDCPSRGQNQVKLNDNQVKSNSSQLQSRQTPTLTLNAFTLRAFDCFKQARLVTERLPIPPCAQCHTDTSLSVCNPKFITGSYWNDFAIGLGRQFGDMYSRDAQGWAEEKISGWGGAQWVNTGPRSNSVSITL